MAHDKKIGYVTEVTNSADKGKSLVLIPSLVYLVLYCGYKLGDVHANFDIYLDGVHRHDNVSIRNFVRLVCSKHLSGKIILIDEANGVWSHRSYDSKSQQEDLRGIWQMTKLGNWLFYTNHLGRGVDKNLRDATQIILIPKYNEKLDTVDCDIINGEDLNFPFRQFMDVSDYFDVYDRWQPIYDEGNVHYVMHGFKDSSFPKWKEASDLLSMASGMGSKEAVEFLIRSGIDLKEYKDYKWR